MELAYVIVGTGQENLKSRRWTVKKEREDHEQSGTSKAQAKVYYSKAKISRMDLCPLLEIF